MVKNKYCLGKHRAVHDLRTLRYRDYRIPLPAVPPQAIWGDKVIDWGMMGNDQYGCCGVAGAGHLILDWTTNAGKPVKLTAKQIIKAYLKYTGGQDNGVCLLDFLKYWRTKGLCGHKIVAFMAIDTKNLTEIKEGINLFGGLYMGFSLPDYVVPDSGNWDIIPWNNTDNPPDPNNGHCIMSPGYKTDIDGVTWGIKKPISVPFVQKYADEGYAIVTQDWIDKQGKSPSGLNLKGLLADLTAIKNG